MRKIKLFTLLAGLFLATSMWATPAQIGTTGLYWEVTGTGTNLTLNITYSGSGTSVIPSYIAASLQPWKNDRSNVTKIVIESGVTGIGNYNFASFTNLTEVDMSAATSLASIGQNAFNGCNNASFTSIAIPQSVTTINNNAFQNCSNLANVTFSGTPTIATIGQQAFQATGIESIALPASVTEVKRYAFQNCASLTSVTFLGETPCVLGLNPFRNSANFEKIYVPDANSQLYANTWLEYWDYLYETTSGNHAPAPHGEGDFGAASNNLHWDVTGSTLTITGSGSTGELDYAALPWVAFNSLIKAVYLPDGITYISEDAFFGVQADEVHIGANPANLTWNDAGDDFKNNHATLCYVPAEYLSDYNTKFNEVNVSFALTPWTSGDCEVALAGSTITVSGSGAMADYANAAAQPWAAYTSDVTTIVIGDGVTHIGNYAFDGCSSLAAIQTQSATPPTLGTDAFNGHAANLEISAYPCEEYASYVSAWDVFEEESFTADCVAPANSCGSGLVWDVTANVLTITKAYPGTGAMNNYSVSYSVPSTPWKDSRTSITSIVIGDGVTSIGNYAFYGCNNSSITAITIPDGVTSIGNYAFYNMTNLVEVTIPNGVNTIGNYAFTQTKITEITLPASVTSIADYAFSFCTALTTVNVLPTTAPTLGTNYSGETNVFYSCSLLGVINYPCGSSESYEAAWSTYSTLLNEDCGGPVGPKVDEITANGDPEHPGVYYSTYYSNKTMALPNNGTEAYIAKYDNVNGEMQMTKIAEGAQVLPANTAVILRGPSASFDMTESDETPVSFTKINNLKGVMSATPTSNNLYQQYYVLSGHSSDNSVQGVGFYTFDGTIPAQKAYLIILSNGNAGAPPRRVRFVFEEEQTATGIDNTNANVKAEKRLENGMLIIEKNGVRYNVQGQIVK